jgi:hypothetical protein
VEPSPADAAAWEAVAAREIADPGYLREREMGMLGPDELEFVRRHGIRSYGSAFWRAEIVLLRLRRPDSDIGDLSADGEVGVAVVTAIWDFVVARFGLARRVGREAQEEAGVEGKGARYTLNIFSNNRLAND